MEARVINPFLTATMHLFETMFHISTQAVAPYVMGKEIAHRWEISGIL